MRKSASHALHISSAVVTVSNDVAEAVCRSIDGMVDAQVFGREGGKIVVVLEGPTSDAVGARLSEIALIDGVASANLVYEQIEDIESEGDGS